MIRAVFLVLYERGVQWVEVPKAAEAEMRPLEFPYHVRMANVFLHWSLSH